MFLSKELNTPPSGTKAINIPFAVNCFVKNNRLSILAEYFFNSMLSANGNE